MAIQLSRDELTGFIEQVFGQVAGEFDILELDGDEITVALNVGNRHLRPGNTVSGPSMFGLADVTAYMIILAHVGKKALAVTTNCSIDFMRKPVADKRVVAKGRLLKLGKALAVVDCLLMSEGEDKPVARASLTYSIPPK